MGDLFGSYGRRIREPGSFHLGPAWDEMFESGGDTEPLLPGDITFLCTMSWGRCRPRLQRPRRGAR